MALVKYRPISKMAAIVNSYRQMLTGVRLHAGAYCFDEAGRDNDYVNLKSQLLTL